MVASGSVIGAYPTLRIAHKAGSAYLKGRFGEGKVSAFLKLFRHWGTGALIASTVIPFPFPTSMFFATAGASNYSRGKYLAIVAICRAARYSAVAIVADLYGPHFIRVLRHPTQYWGWSLLFADNACWFYCYRNSDQQAISDRVGGVKPSGADFLALFSS